MAHVMSLAPTCFVKDMETLGAIGKRSRHNICISFTLTKQTVWICPPGRRIGYFIETYGSLE